MLNKLPALGAGLLTALFTATAGLADAASDRLDAYDRIAERYEKDREGPSPVSCKWYEKIDRSGLITFQVGRTATLSIGVDNDRTTATKKLGGDINIQFTQKTSNARSKKERCIGNDDVRGVLPSVLDMMN